MVKREFSLEKVLRVREVFLDKERNHLSRLNMNMRTLEEKLSSVNKMIEIKNVEMNNLINEGQFGINDIYNKYINVLHNDANNVNVDIASVAKLIDLQQLKINKAYQDLKVMEKLKEKHKIEYQTYIMAKEARENDELNILRKGVGDEDRLY